VSQLSNSEVDASTQLSPVDPTVSQRLADLVTTYNKLPDSEHLKKLFILQNMCYVTYVERVSPALIAWQNQVGASGLESHLQRYGVHRDASQLLQSVEFANAVKQVGGSTKSSEQSLFAAMTTRDSLFAKPMSDEVLRDYAQSSMAIMAGFDADKGMQEKVARNQHFLALSYAKIDAIQGFIKEQQGFKEYKTDVLGNLKGNNKNFTLGIDGEDRKAVIRVEGWSKLDNDRVLQTHKVSNYFSEDYARLMVPIEIDGVHNHKAVVISEYANKGDLRSYAEGLVDQKPKVIRERLHHFFQQLNDFNIELMKSGHYHPDIKLSNFLTDGDRLIVSDRKTLTNDKTPRVSEINSSPFYGAPEYKQCVSENRLNFRASQVRLDMPSYMAYQTGMALKEFMIASQLVPKNMDHSFEEWHLVTEGVKAPSDKVKNLAVLAQELTRPVAADRLSINHFQTLLSQVHLAPKQFMEWLSKLSPNSGLSTYNDTETIRAALQSRVLSPDLEKKIRSLENLESNCQDPRLNLPKLLKGKPLEQVSSYLEEVEKALLKRDKINASNSSKWVHNLTGGLKSVARVSEPDDLGASLPKMNELTKFCIQVSMASGHQSFPGLGSKQQELLNKIVTLQQRAPARELESTTVKDLPTDSVEQTSRISDSESTTVLSNSESTMVFSDSESLGVQSNYAAALKYINGDGKEESEPEFIMPVFHPDPADSVEQISRMSDSESQGIPSNDAAVLKDINGDGKEEFKPEFIMPVFHPDPEEIGLSEGTDSQVDVLDTSTTQMQESSMVLGTVQSNSEKSLPDYMKAYLDSENRLEEDLGAKKQGVVDVISRGDRSVPEAIKSTQSFKDRLGGIKSAGQVDNNKSEIEEDNLRNFSSPN
jgi:hypothetical protein